MKDALGEIGNRRCHNVAGVVRSWQPKGATIFISEVKRDQVAFRQVGDRHQPELVLTDENAGRVRWDIEVYADMSADCTRIQEVQTFDAAIHPVRLRHFGIGSLGLQSEQGQTHSRFF